ncbi:RING finger protein [Patulibacter sp. NPDC049589]|uniref:RING finger protein n=1 Tax=Patulibacter sp. NPDC049589 TaxID=3154731 RepID=UPI003429D45E
MSVIPDRPATAADAGRSCPYCRFPLKQGATVVDCPGCQATHHDDCWAEGTGCAVVGCGTTIERTPVGSPPPPVTGVGTPTETFSAPVGSGLPFPPPPAPPPVASASPGRSGTRWILAAIGVLTVVVAVAAVLLLTRDDGAAPAGDQASRDQDVVEVGHPRAQASGGSRDAESGTGGGSGGAGAAGANGTSAGRADSDQQTRNAFSDSDEQTRDRSSDSTSPDSGTPASSGSQPSSSDSAAPPNGTQRTSSSANGGLLGAESQIWSTDTNTGAMEQTIRRHWQARADGDFVRAHMFFTGSVLAKSGSAERYAASLRRDGLREVQIYRVGRVEAGPAAGRVRVGVRTLDGAGCWNFAFVYSLQRIAGKWRISDTGSPTRTASAAC